MDQEKSARQVLVVDDDEKLLGVTEELLTRRGYRVTVCQQSTRVVPLLKEQHFDVALLDIRMPEFEGTDLLPLMKKLRPELPVILVSAYCDKDNSAYYHSLGAFDIVSKPFSTELLADMVARAGNEQEQIPMTITGLSLRGARDQLYRKLILAALRKTDWNQMRASELLGVSRYCLMRWMKKLGISY